MDAVPQAMEPLPHVVILGGGFGGIQAARHLRRAPVRVTLIDRRNFHLFQPLLYQVATGALSPANIAAPLRSILRRNTNCEVWLGEVADIDVANRRVILTDGEIRYDFLIIATGARHSYFGQDDWEPFAPGLKTIEDATEIRKRILYAFEAAERLTDPQERAAWLTFVIVGAGPTGVELAGALSEIARYTLRRDFRQIDPQHARIFLIEAGDRPLPSFPPALSQKAAASLAELGVTLRTETKVTGVQADHVVLDHHGETEILPTRTVVWAAGVQASPLGKSLADQGVAQIDRAGRVLVEPNLTLPGHPEVFVIGDLAHFPGPDGRPLPGVAPVAMQQGRHAARTIRRRLRNEPDQPFQYRDRGALAVIGRSRAVALIFGRQLSGYFAWIVWLFVHLMELVQFENRVLVLMQWAWNFVTRNRAARLITGALPDAVKERSADDRIHSSTEEPAQTPGAIK